MNFNDLFKRNNQDVFFSEYYEKKFYYDKLGVSFFVEDFINEQELYDYLSRNDIVYPSVRMAKDGKELDKNLYFSKSPFVENSIDRNLVLSQYTKGATIVVQAFERGNSKVGKFCNSFGLTKKIGSSCNIYITPKESQGFNYHYDTHDVFVFQIAGKKRFKLYSIPYYLPTTNHGHNYNIDFKSTDWDKETPIFDEVLESGDILYMPRGLVHVAQTIDDYSIHCSFGMYPIKWSDVYLNVFGGINNIENLRETVKLEDVTSNQINENNKIIQNLFDSNRVERKIEKLVQEKILKYNNTCYKPCHGNYYSINNLSKITLKSTLKLNTELNFKKEFEKIYIDINDELLILPVYLEESLIYIRDSITFKIFELIDLDDESKMLIAKTLIENRILIINEI